ncbi:hypothetical protein AH4AK4_1579 [Aeromonas hydrophila 4AK4]|nr:hypothetical protein AH4AK4_1579 [Aeromonas hydrophila 4AK4]
MSHPLADSQPLRSHCHRQPDSSQGLWGSPHMITAHISLSGAFPC